jgi:hypothetical protein
MLCVRRLCCCAAWQAASPRCVLVRAVAARLDGLVFMFSCCAQHFVRFETPRDENSLPVLLSKFAQELVLGVRVCGLCAR